MYCIITHGDLDGLTAAAILLDVLEKKGYKTVILIAQPFTLNSALSKVDSFRSVSKLYIIDVGIDPATWEKTKNILAKLRLRADILWIDHHRATLQKIEELAKLGISLIYSIDGSAASIMKYAYLEYTSDPDFFSKLALMGEIGDKVKEVKDDEMAKIVEIVGSSLSANSEDDDFKIKMIHLWVREKKIYNEEIEERAKKAKEKLYSLIKEAKTRVIFEGDRLVIIDFRGVPARGYIGKIASDYANKNNKITIIIFNSGPNEVVATCRVPQSLEFNALNKLLEIARKLGGSGGGHPRACSIRVPVSFTESLKNELLALDKT